jgi:hypothetical protein
MPKDKVDYSNTTIYKIFCNDESITDLYVGHTTNFIVRKYQHKNACNNHNINRKIYKTIRENGGWDNWNMAEIAKYNCKNSTEARIKEQEHYNLLKPSLNCVLPYNDNTTYSMFSEENKEIKEKFFNYNCEYCDFRCLYKSDWNRHISTSKHISNKGENDLENKQIKNSFICDCGKDFKTNSGLWKHSKKCKIQQNDTTDTTSSNKMTDKDLIMMLIKQNACLMEQNNQLVDMLKVNNI